MSRGRLQLVNGSKLQAIKLIENLHILYRRLKWVPRLITTEEGGTMKVSCHTLMNGRAVDLMALWWGTWVAQDKLPIGSQSEPMLRFAVHDGHPLYKKIKIIQDYAWKASGDE